MSDHIYSGWFAAPNAIFASDLTATEKLVLLYLYRCANGNGQSWPSLNTIGEAIGIGRTLTCQTVKALQAKNWIHAQHRETKEDGHRSNLYTLVLPLFGNKINAEQRQTNDPISPSDPPLSRQATYPGPPSDHEGLHNEGQPNKKDNGGPIRQTKPDHGAETAPTSSSDEPTDEAIAEVWNAIAAPEGLPVVTALSRGRRKHLAARKTTGGRDRKWWQAYFTRIAKSPFCRGFNARGWKASFDFAIRSEEVVLKVLEGVYGGEEAKPRRPVFVEAPQ